MIDTPTVRLPTVHLNGTSQEELLSQICDAANAIRKARTALANAAPNARDYYPQGDRAYTLAAEAHAARDAKLLQVLNEISALGEGVADGGHCMVAK